jgi:P27 family predicted phage terminase small subunit
MRGPQPKPDRLKALEGNPGKRALNKKEPRPTGRIRKPAFLMGPAAEEFDRAVKAMPDGFYTRADEPVMAVYCTAWVLFREAADQMAREGISRPLHLVVTKQAEIIMRASDRLGMSPAARTRLSAPEEDDGGKFAGLFGGSPLQLATQNGRSVSATSSNG